MLPAGNCFLSHVFSFNEHTLNDQDLIYKFLAQRCNAAEAARVHRYLEQHPELLQQLFQKDWDDAGTGESISPEAAATLLQSIEDRIRNKRSVVSMMRPWAAVAAVMLVVLGAWTILHKAAPENKTALIQQQVQPAEQAIAASSWQEHLNTGTGIEKMKLPDGTTVLLSPSAMIRYQAVFSNSKREIFLKGDAQFDVAKDKARPFTVFAGNLSTTALGTSFRIRNSNDTVLVQLLTGKVLIRPVTEAIADWKQDVYLLPGQQLQYSVSGGLVKFSGSRPKKTADTVTATTDQHTDQEMVFNNTPLEEVFRKLQSHHNKPISYSAEDIRELSFTGTIFYKDSLPLILQAIARMNDLEILPDQQGFIIKKGQE